jgi:hypothetical protein
MTQKSEGMAPLFAHRNMSNRTLNVHEDERRKAHRDARSLLLAPWVLHRLDLRVLGILSLGQFANLLQVALAVDCLLLIPLKDLLSQGLRQHQMHACETGHAARLKLSFGCSAARVPPLETSNKKHEKSPADHLRFPTHDVKNEFLS